MRTLPCTSGPNRTAGFIAGIATIALTGAAFAIASTSIDQSATGSKPAQPATKDAAPAPAKAEIEAKAQEVLDRAVEVTLGKYAKDRSLKATRMSGRMEMAGAGISASMTMVIDDQGRQAMVMDIPGLGKMRSGLTKDLGWSFSEMTGPVIMSDDERRQAQQQADLYSSLDWGKRASKIVYVGESEIELPDGSKRPTHELRMTMRETGTDETHHFDREHGWQVRSSSMQMIPGQGRIPLTTTFTEYKDVEGMKVPFRTTVAMGPQRQEIIIEEVEVNPTLDAETFEVPAEVKQVAGK